MAEQHTTRLTSWLTVALIVLSSIAFGFALPMESIVLAVVGAVLLVAGIVCAVVYRIMDDAH